MNVPNTSHLIGISSDYYICTMEVFKAMILYQPKNNDDKMPYFDTMILSVSRKKVRSFSFHKKQLLDIY